MNNEEFNDLITNNQELIVDFWAEWCGPCRAVSPALEEISAETGIELVKINIDESFELSQIEGVQSIPLVRLYRDGVAVASSLGAKPKTVLKTALGL